MGKGVPKETLWDASLNWMKKNHGKNFGKDKKGTLNRFLDHLDGLIGKVASIIEDEFVALDLEVIEEAGIVPLIVPEKLSYLLGSSFILQSKVSERLKFKAEPSIEKTGSVESFEEEEDIVIKDDPIYEQEEEDDPSYEQEEEDDTIDDSSHEQEEEEEEDGIYTCAKCSSTHETYDDLVDHLKKPCVAEKEKSTKKRKGRFNASIEDRTCQTCSKTFTSYRYLKYNHSLLCKGSELDPVNFSLLQCPYCQKEYKTIRNYYLHLKRCSEKSEDQVIEKINSSYLSDVVCWKCGFIASSKEELKNSIHQCEAKKRFMCTKCDYRTFNFSSLRSHDLAIHHKDEPTYCCEICGAKYSYKTGFDRHLKTHGEKPPKIRCPHCVQLFSGKSTLGRHMKSCHRPVQQHPCDTCGKIFSTSRYLSRHIKSQHTEVGRLIKHECTFCHNCFREKSYLRKHIRKKHSNSL